MSTKLTVPVHALTPYTCKMLMKSALGNFKPFCKVDYFELLKNNVKCDYSCAACIKK
jgi:hypothetical protein